MSVQIGQTVPDFEAETTQGTIKFHDWIGDSWAVLFSHPKDFTPVCTTELGTLARMKPEFDKRNTKLIGLSVDPVSSHAKWSEDIRETQGHAPNYPLIRRSHARHLEAVWHVAGVSARLVRGPHRRR
jgi:alkyl hydroperoxide reductase subunit AhpC